MSGLGRRISVIGAGHVGLTTAACLAHIGHRVTCGEADTTKLARLQAGEATFFEAHLDGLIARTRAECRLRFAGTEEAIRAGDVIFICVGTPSLPGGEADLSAIENVAQAVARRVAGDVLVVEKSTVPVRADARLNEHLRLYGGGNLRCQVVSDPEFLREGRAIDDFFHPERIVVGTDSPAAAQVMRRLYSPVLEPAGHCPVHGNCPPGAAPVLLATDIPSAELIKHASNSFLATKISFANLIADLCEATGADVATVTRGMGLDSRIGPAFLRAGIGFGGFCLPKDLQALARMGENLGCDASLLCAAEAINMRRVPALLEKLRRELRVMRWKAVALWGWPSNQAWIRPPGPGDPGCPRPAGSRRNGSGLRSPGDGKRPRRSAGPRLLPRRMRGRLQGGRRAGANGVAGVLGARSRACPAEHAPAADFRRAQHVRR